MCFYCKDTAETLEPADGKEPEQKPAEKSSKNSSKKNDPDYINGTEFSYDFYDLSATVGKEVHVLPNKLIDRIKNAAQNARWHREICSNKIT